VIDDRETTEIETVVAGNRADCLLIAENCDTRESLAGGFGGGDHRAWIIPFGQNDVLRP
jgi:hypothetical protein